MDYRRFERLVLLLAGATILASTLVDMSASMSLSELVAQLLLFGVVAAAVHWGRRAGFLAATIASLLYLTVFVAQATGSGLLAFDSLLVVLSRVLAFGIVGIVGGEACGRIKYALAALAGESAIDETTGVYNQRYAARAVEIARGRSERFDEPFSVVMLMLSEGLWTDMTPKRRQQLIRASAAHLRTEARLVDEVARLDDGSFLILLPNTPKDGAQLFAQRAGSSLRRMLGAADRSVRIAIYGGEEDPGWIATLLDLMRRPQSSDAYSAAGDRTEKPASRSAVAAVGSSTFKTSTAAVAKGSTKQ